MKKVCFVLFTVLFLASCSKDSSVDAFLEISHTMDDNYVQLEKEIEVKISQIKDDSLKGDALKFDELTHQFILYIKEVNSQLLRDLDIDKETSINNVVLSESKRVNDLFFNGNMHSPKGKEFVEKIISYRIALLSFTESITLREKINTTLNTDNLLAKDGKEVGWLEHNFKDFPMIAVVSKLKTYKVDALQLESDFLSEKLNSQN
ncbi:MAG TPA: hypothetical protein VLZ11_02610 [Flavobacterium sp.]|nr:hypothetical protein [Flavobacterium sp.]